jgi:hypothetical protein
MVRLLFQMIGINIRTRHTFSSCWKELGCCALSIVREAVDEGLLREVEGREDEGLGR